MPFGLIRIVRMLRSRRLAIGLIAGLAVYGVIGTLVPRGALSNVAVQKWAAEHPVAEAIATPLGLHEAFSSPLFIVLAALLAASTAACAVERTRRARTIMRTTLHLSEASLDRLRARPQAEFRIAADVEPSIALATASTELAKSGLRMRLDDTSADGRAGVVGLMGSPLFHWSIVALMLVAAAGQATRSEGFMALPLGERIAEDHAGYLQITEGPFFREGHTGIELEAEDIDRDYSADGVDYGPTPLVTAYKDTVRIASGRVHPNSPLRVGSLMVHMAEFGPAVTLAIESDGGAEIGRDTFTLDRSGETSSGTKPQTFTLPGGPEAPEVAARVQVVIQRTTTANASAAIVSRAILETATAGSSSYGQPVIIAEGEAIDLPGDRRLRVAKVKDWVRVSVANDWSVPFIYGLLITTTIGLALAVLVPTKRASVLLVEDDAGYALHVGTWHARRDPLFKRQVLDAVRIAAGETEKQ